MSISHGSRPGLNSFGPQGLSPTPAYARNGDENQGSMPNGNFYVAHTPQAHELQPVLETWNNNRERCVLSGRWMLLQSEKRSLDFELRPQVNSRAGSLGAGEATHT